MGALTCGEGFGCRGGERWRRTLQMRKLSLSEQKAAMAGPRQSQMSVSRSSLLCGTPGITGLQTGASREPSGGRSWRERPSVSRKEGPGWKGVGAACSGTEGAVAWQSGPGGVQQPPHSGTLDVRP